MPVYPYKCDRCGGTFDIVQPIADHPPTDCPECSEGGAGRFARVPGTLRRVYGGMNLAVGFRGPGFYTTDKKG